MEVQMAGTLQVEMAPRTALVAPREVEQRVGKFPMGTSRTVETAVIPDRALMKENHEGTRRALFIIHTTPVIIAMHTAPCIIIHITFPVRITDQATTSKIATTRIALLTMALHSRFPETMDR